MNREQQESIITAKAGQLNEDLITEVKNKINDILQESFGPEFELDEMKISIKGGDDKSSDIPFSAFCIKCYYPDGTPYYYCGGNECPG